MAGAGQLTYSDMVFGQKDLLLHTIYKITREM